MYTRGAEKRKESQGGTVQERGKEVIAEARTIGRTNRGKDKGERC